MTMENDWNYTITSTMSASFSSVREFSMYRTWWILSFYTTHKLTPTDFISVDAVYYDLHDIPKKADYDVSMLMFCFEYLSSVMTPQPHASKLFVTRCNDCVLFFTMACNYKLNLKHNGNIQIRLIRAKRHLCNCWLIWLGFLIFMSQLEYLLQGLVVALVCLFLLLEAIAA